LFTVGMGPGNSVGATTSTRAMMNTTAKLTYGLYTDAAWTLNWDDIAGTNVLAGTGTGADQLLPVYGKVPAGQTAILTGAYADVVNVTVNF
jgi:spore coat protein U-like protein